MRMTSMRMRKILVQLIGGKLFTSSWQISILVGTCMYRPIDGSTINNVDCHCHTVETKEDRIYKEKESYVPCAHEYAKTTISRPTHIAGGYHHVLSVSWVVQTGRKAYNRAPWWYYPYYRLERSAYIATLGTCSTKSGIPRFSPKILGDRLYATSYLHRWKQCSDYRQCLTLSVCIDLIWDQPIVIAWNTSMTISRDRI
jgi:hypothetical protein